MVQVISERDFTEEDDTFVVTTQELLTEVPIGDTTKLVTLTNNFSPLKAGDQIYVQAFHMKTLMVL